MWITIPLSILGTSKSKVAISLPDLVRETNSFSVQYQGRCAATLLDSNPKDLFLKYNVKCSKPDSDPAGHDVIVHFDVNKLNETHLAKDLDVRCSCSCPAFLYWGAQWNLHQRDGLEGQPRPELRAPTERMDLRGHFVICKHCYVVFKRILPSVQHNIVKILREREVQRKKEEGKIPEAPEKLQKEQEELKRKNELERIKKIKDKDVQREMLEALRKDEEEKMQKEQKQPAWMKLPQHYEDQKMKEPTTMLEEIEGQEPEPPKHLPEPERNVLRDLYKEEIKERRDEHAQLKKEEVPHVHEGLPYKTDKQLLEEKKKKTQKPNEMKEFLNRRRSSEESQAYCPKCKKTTSHTKTDHGLKCSACGAEGKTIQERAQ